MHNEVYVVFYMTTNLHDSSEVYSCHHTYLLVFMGLYVIGLHKTESVAI